MNYQKALDIYERTGWWRSSEWGTYAVGANDRKRGRKAFKKRYSGLIRRVKRATGNARLAPRTIQTLRAATK